MRIRNCVLSWAARLTTLTWHRRTPVLGDWVRMFKPNWREIALDLTIDKLALRVLILCCVSLGPANMVLLRQRQIAKLLQRDPSDISRAIRALVKMGLILQEGHCLYVNSRLVADQAPQIVAKMRGQEALQLCALEAGYTEQARKS